MLPTSCFFFCLVIEPVIELHLPWKHPSAVLHYSLFHSPCDNTEDGRQHFQAHMCNSLFLLFHFQIAPWADSQASPQEAHQGLSHPHVPSHSTLLPLPQLLLSLLRKLLWGWKPAGTGEVLQGDAAAQTFFPLDLASDFG